MTSFGINNEGGLVFDYYHEDTDQVNGANVYNGQLSTLWVNFRQSFPDKIGETYRDLRSNSVLNYEELTEQFITNGSDRWSESVYNEDGDFKYVSMLRSSGDASNLPQVRGTGEEHLRYFFENRLNYCDSKHFAADYADDYVVVRIYTPVDANGVPRTDLVIPACADITVTPYSHMYAGVRYKANGTLYQERLDANETYTFEAPEETFNDTETAIYGASQLSSVGDLAPLYCGYIDVSKATKLVELKVGDGTEGYANTNLEHLSVGTNRLLKKIDIQNCPNFESSLSLIGCPNIEEIYAFGSNITGVELPDSGYIKVIELPASVSNLTLKNQIYIERMVLEGYNSLKTLWLENCPTVNSLEILNAAQNVERARLTNVNWSWEDATALLTLSERSIGGIDENGSNTTEMWIDGTCHIDRLTGSEYAELRQLYPYLNITYTELTAQLVYMSEDGQTELYRETIINEGDGTDPVASGAIDTPTKESTDQYHFTYSGWSLTSGGEADPTALNKVAGDRIVYVAFSNELRSYTVNFYNGTVLEDTKVVFYDCDAEYSKDTPVKNDVDNPEDFEFIGWLPVPTNIKKDTDCYAQYYDTREIQDDWATIKASCLDGTYATKYPIGSYKPVEINYDDGTSETIEFEVVGHDHDELTDDATRWIQLGNLRTNNYGGSVCCTYNNIIYNLYGTSFYSYDVKNNKLTQLASLPYGLVGKSSLLVYDDSIHVFTVQAYQNNDKLHYIYDIKNNVWTESTPSIVSNYATNHVVFNGYVYLFGVNGGKNESVYRYSTSDGWVDTGAVIPASYVTYPVVYNGEIHFGMGIANNVRTHYTFNGTAFSLVGTLPFEMTNMSLITIRNKLHAIGGTENNYAHYVYDGVSWTDMGGLVFPSNRHHSAFIYDNALCYSSNDGYIIKYNTSEFVDIGHAQLRSGQGISPFVCNNSLYMMNGDILCKVDISIDSEYTVTSLASIPESYPRGYRYPAVYNNNIYVLTGTTNAAALLMYDFDSNSFTETIPCPVNIAYGDYMFAMNDALHILRLKEHHIWDGTSWNTHSTPVEFYHCSGTLHNNEFHVVGRNNNIAEHYKYNGTDWTKVCDTPHSFYLSHVVSYEGELYSVGGVVDRNAWYRFDGTNWIDTGRIAPYTEKSGYCGSGICVYNGKIYMQAKPYNSNLWTLHRLDNPKAPITFLARNLLCETRWFRNTSAAPYNSWKESYLRAWLNSDFKTYIPSELSSVISEALKPTSSGGRDYELDMVNTDDSIWIPSISEVGLSHSYPYNQGLPYSVFTNSASRIRNSLAGDIPRYFLRSAYPNSNTGAYVYQVINATGNTSSGGATEGSGVLPGFCI